MLKLLKEATSSRHAAIERQWPLLDPSLSIASYHRFIQDVFGFYVSLEFELLAAVSCSTVDFDYAPRQKTPRLRQDLLALGDTETTIAALPRCERLPSLTNAAQRWGCLYVIEGATLGGQIITKHLHRNLGLSANSGASFFNGYGTQTSVQWKAFCAVVPVYGEASAGDRDAMLSGANQTFDALSEWLFPGSVASFCIGLPDLSHTLTSVHPGAGADSLVVPVHA